MKILLCSVFFIPTMLHGQFDYTKLQVTHH